MSWLKEKKGASTTATKIETLEKEASTYVTRIANLEKWTQDFDDMNSGWLTKIWDRLHALELESSSHHANKQEGPSPSVGERLAVLEADAQRNREYVDNITNSIQKIEEKMKQSDKTLENFGDIMMTTGAKEDLEKKLDMMKVDCEISNKVNKELMMSNVERVKKDLVITKDDMMKVEHNLLKTEKKLDEKYESLRKTTRNDFESFENLSKKVLDNVDSIKSLVDLEENVKIDVQMMKAIVTTSHSKIESTQDRVRNVQDDLDKMKDDANSLRNVIETMHETIEMKKPFENENESTVSRLVGDLGKRLDASHKSLLKKVEAEERKREKIVKDLNSKLIPIENSKSSSGAKSAEQPSHELVTLKREIEIIKDIITIRHCNICRKKMKTLDGLFHHVETVHKSQEINAF